MALLSDKDRDFLKGKFEAELKGDLHITFFTQGESGLAVPGQECAVCKDTHQLLEEVAALSDKLHLKVLDFVADGAKAQEYGVDKIPATLLSSGDGQRIRFFGHPSGYEFAVLIEDLLSLSKGSSGLSAGIQEQLKGLTKPIHIQVFVTPT